MRKGRGEMEGRQVERWKHGKLESGRVEMWKGGKVETCTLLCIVFWFMGIGFAVPVFSIALDIFKDRPCYPQSLLGSPVTLG